MRIGIVHPYPVHARAVGGTTRVYALVRHLAARHSVTVLAHASGSEEADRGAVGEMAALGVEQRLFPLSRPALWRRVPWTVGSTPYFVHRNRNAALERAIASLDVDVVHVEHGYLAPLLAGLRPGTARLLAEQETMSLAITRLREAPARSAYEWYLLSQRRKVAAFERRAFAAYDRICAISPAEAQYLGTLTGRSIGLVPHVVDTTAFRPRAGDASGAGVLFVGNYAHRPNGQGLAWFLEHVWPRVRAAAPSAGLDVVGPGLSAPDRERVARAGGRPRGRVEDLVAAYRDAAVFVNPMRTGGGMRGKVLEAFACGGAVVSTSMGMEGVDARDGEHGQIADEPEGFAAAVMRYLADPALRARHGAAARALVERAYDPRVVFPRVEDEYAAAVASRRQATA